MKVLHVIPTLHEGGAERFAAQLVAHQRRLGLDARACVFRPGAVDARWCEGAPRPIELDYRPRQGAQGRLATATLVRQLRAVILRETPEIVHTHLWPACKIVFRATRTEPVRQVWHVHDAPDWLARLSIAARLQRAQMRLMIRQRKPTLVTCCRYARREVVRALKLEEERVEVVVNGVDTQEFYPAPGKCGVKEGPSKLIMIAAFRPLKGHADLIEAVALLRRKGVQCQLTLAGNADSPTGNAIRRQVNSCGLEDAVSFGGQVGDVASALREHDVFVLPSAAEGLPLAVLEAMSCGLPVIVTRVGGIPELVTDGQTGLVVEPGDPKALAERIQMLIESPGLRQRLGCAGAELVAQRYSFGQCVERIIAAYHALSGSSARARMPSKPVPC